MSGLLFSVCTFVSRTAAEAVGSVESVLCFPSSFWESALFADFHSCGIYAEFGITAVIPSFPLCRVKLANVPVAWVS